MDSFDHLVHRYIDDRQALSADELDALIAGLRAEPARAAALHEQLLLDDLVSQKLAVDRGDFPAQVGQRIADHERGEAEMDGHVAELRAIAESQIERPPDAAGTSPWLKVLIGLAATVLVAAVLLAPRLAKRPVQLATLSSVTGDVLVEENGEQRAIGNEATLYTGQTLQVPAGGEVTLTYADQTKLTLADGAEARFDLANAAKQVHLARGALTASIQPQSVGMAFTTPHATATVLGTQLRLSVSETETLLNVSEGRVQFDRLAGVDAVAGKTTIVRRGESARASPQAFDVRPLRWPPSRDGLALLISSVETRDGGPLMVARNPDSGNLRDAVLAPHGNVAIDESTQTFQLRGGYFTSEEAGHDAARSMNGKGAFTIELVAQPASLNDNVDTQIVSLADNAGFEFFALRQSGSQVRLELRTAADLAPVVVSVPLANDRAPQHLAFSYQGSEVVAYLAGAEVASLPYRAGPIHWPPSVLVIGAGPGGQHAWHGVLEGLAIGSRAIGPAEAAESARNHRVLAGRGM